MKLLFVGPLFPLPAHSGGQIATLETLRSLLPLCEIHLLVPPPEHDRETNEAALRRLLPDIHLHFYPAPVTRRLQMYATAVRAAVTGQSYWALSWRNCALRASVKALHAREAFDAVHCEWLQAAVPLRGLDLPLVIRTPDIHFLDMETWAGSQPSTLRRWYWSRQAKRFRRFEAETLAAARSVVVLSAEDEIILRGCGVQNIVMIPPPRALEPEAPHVSSPVPLGLFLGRLDMAPNREAFFLFTDEIWPRVREEIKRRLRVVFAGGAPDDHIRRRAAESGIEIHAPLSDADAARLFAEADLFLSPIRSGTGIKVKTLDAMALGKPMIGFRGAFRGVPVENGLHAVIVETPEDFALAIEQLIDDEPRRQTIGAAARDFIRTQFDPAILGERLARIYAHVAQSGKP